MTRRLETSEAEIADIIFSSDDTELNDMMLVAQNNKYNLMQLIVRIVDEINTRSYDKFRQLEAFPSDRYNYLKDQIRYEMRYYTSLK